MKGGEIKVNVGLMNLVSSTANVSQPNTDMTSINTGEKSSSKFGDVFSKVLAAENSAPVTEIGGMEELESLQSLADLNSLEDILDLLGVLHDGSFITIDNEVKNFDELMNLDDLLSILGMNLPDLQAIMSSLLGEDVQSTDVWQIVEQINANADKVISNLQLALQGKGDMTEKDALAFLKFIKLTQLAGNKSDLVMNQPLQLINLKELVETVIKEVVTVKSSGQVSIQNFQQTVEKAIISEETASKNNNLQAAEATLKITVQAEQNVSTKTVTIQLPTEKASQAEELANRIEKLINQSQISKNPGIVRLQLKLYPEHLGSIRIELVHKDGVVSARLLATTAVGKELLDSQLHQLKNAFVQQNIQLDRIDVQQALQDKDLRDQNLFNNFFNQQNQNQEEETNDKHDDSDDNQDTPSFQELLQNVEV